MSRVWGDKEPPSLKDEFGLKSILKEMPLWMKVIFIGQFVVYAAIVYVAYHFISKVW